MKFIWRGCIEKGELIQQVGNRGIIRMETITGYIYKPVMKIRKHGDKVPQWYAVGGNARLDYLKRWIRR